ncbi:MAG: hypothetical protein IPL47_15725 [Phyllobacteriaceae bacterium]|nr:hypothetical protein [Phyllobacteriaceae bacterium]
MRFEGEDTTIDFKADAIDLRHAGDKDLSKVLVYKKADATKQSKVLFEAKSDFRGEGVFYLPGDEIEFKIARVAGAPGFGFGAIARLVLLDIAKGETFAFKPLIRIEDGEATLNEGAAIRLLR